MNTRRMARKAVSLLLTLILAIMIPTAALADTANEAVNKATSGVVQVNALYLDPNNNVWTGYAGTAFLINEEYLLTCDHVFDLEAEDIAAGKEAYGWSEKQIREHSKIEVVVMRDVTIEATIVNESDIMDFAILKLSQELYDRTYLPLRSSSEIKQTEQIYSLGFPGGISAWQDANTYTSEDVTITAGQVNKLNTIGTVDYIQHGAQISGGNSGGPLVDEAGAVIGINVFTAGAQFESGYSYALAIDQPIKVLDSLGIAYTKNTDPVSGDTDTDNDVTESEPEEDATPAETVETDKSELRSALTEAGMLDTTMYEDDEQMVQFNNALSAAKRVSDNDAATQEEIDSAAAELSAAQSALTPKAESSAMIWIIVAIAAVVVIAVIVIVVLVTGSKKKAKNAMGAAAPAASFAQPGGFQPVGRTPAPSTPSVFPPMQNAGETEVLGQGSNETTVLGQGSNETTVLSRNLGVLTRTKTNEKISVNTNGFVIGRERAKVNYCVSDNTSVGRTHIRISSRGNDVVVEDLQSRNGTFVNGVKISAGQPVVLSDGDKIALSDEEFVYRT